MNRLELIANQSLQEDIFILLDRTPGLRYSVVPTVHGRGKDRWSLGTNVWPEANFLAIIYLPAEATQTLIGSLSALKAQYQGEGLVAFQIEGATRLLVPETPGGEGIQGL